MTNSIMHRVNAVMYRAMVKNIRPYINQTPDINIHNVIQNASSQKLFSVGDPTLTATILFSMEDFNHGTLTILGKNPE